MKDHMIGKNGIGYTLGEDGMYYPDLSLSEGTDYQIGRFGSMRGILSKKIVMCCICNRCLQANGMNICMGLMRSVIKGWNFL